MWSGGGGDERKERPIVMQTRDGTKQTRVAVSDGCNHIRIGDTRLM